MNVPAIFTHPRNILILLVGIVCVVTTSLPVFSLGFFRPHDFTHAARIAEMNRSLRAGEFPVRWSENFGFGYGMPLFHFYAPLPYYIAQVPYALTGNAIVAIKFLYVLNSVLAFGGMYLFASKFWRDPSRIAPLLAAVFFSFSTYRALDLFVRGAIGEVYAMVLIPFALYGVMEIDSKRLRGISIASLSLAAILLSHNLIGMLSIPLFVIFGLVLIRDRLSVVRASLLGFGIAAFYVLPAYVEKEYTRVEQTITGGYFDFHHHFVALRQFLFGTWGYGGSVAGLEDGMSFALGILPLLCTLVVLLAWTLRGKRDKQILSIWFVAVLLVGSIFMASNRATVVWEQIDILKFLQFPWRFLTFTHVFLALLSGGLTLSFQKNRFTVWILLCTLAAMLILQAKFFRPEKYLLETSDYYSTEPAFIRSTMSKTLNDYIPASIQGEMYPEPIQDRIQISNGEGSIDMQTNSPARLRFIVRCISACELRINIFDFPNWSIKIDGVERVLERGRAFPISFVSLSSGTYDISVQLRDTPIRRIGNLMSLASLGILAAALLRAMKTKHL